MSIEEMLLSAEAHGKRTEIFKAIEQIKEKEPYLQLHDMYEKAYEMVMKV